MSDGQNVAIHRAIEAVWRIESAKIIAGVARLVGDVGLAEDLAQDALVAALERWPQSGTPDNPGAWLMATAKHRAIDLLRRDRMLERCHQCILCKFLGEADVAHHPRHAGDDLRGLDAPDRVDRLVGGGMHRAVLRFRRDRVRVHVGKLPDMAVGVGEAVAVHEAVVLRRVG